MKEELKQIVNNVEPRSKRSKLAPYLNDIQELRNNGYSYKQISTMLFEAFELQISEPRICKYLQRINQQESGVGIAKCKHSKDIATKEPMQHQKVSSNGEFDAFLSKRPQPIKSIQE